MEESRIHCHDATLPSCATFLSLFNAWTKGIVFMPVSHPMFDDGLSESREGTQPSLKIVVVHLFFILQAPIKEISSFSQVEVIQ